MRERIESDKCFCGMLEKNAFWVYDERRHTMSQVVRETAVMVTTGMMQSWWRSRRVLRGLPCGALREVCGRGKTLRISVVFILKGEG